MNNNQKSYTGLFDSENKNFDLPRKTDPDALKKFKELEKQAVSILTDEERKHLQEVEKKFLAGEL